MGPEAIVIEANRPRRGPFKAIVVDGGGRGREVLFETIAEHGQGLGTNGQCLLAILHFADTQFGGTAMVVTFTAAFTDALPIFVAPLPVLARAATPPAPVAATGLSITLRCAAAAILQAEGSLLALAANIATAIVPTLLAGALGRTYLAESQAIIAFEPLAA